MQLHLPRSRLELWWRCGHRSTIREFSSPHLFTPLYSVFHFMFCLFYLVKFSCLVGFLPIVACVIYLLVSTCFLVLLHGETASLLCLLVYLSGWLSMHTFVGFPMYVAYMLLLLFIWFCPPHLGQCGLKCGVLLYITCFFQCDHTSFMLFS